MKRTRSMKKIYKTILLSGLVGTLLSSCSDWLNVYPSDQIKEEYLFETGNGYRTALNGIYRSMTSYSTYGSNLKWGIIDAWGQVYDMEKLSDENGGKPMKKIAKLEFKNFELVPTTDKMWSDVWNLVANCNELAQQAEKADSMLFYDGERERQMILGEAIGLRAYIQFDLLRIYAPSPKMEPGNRTFIPYVNVYPAYLNNRETVSYCLEQIIKDLTKSQELLLDVDKTTGWSKRFDEGPNNEKLFLNSRGFRLNYYAVTAELARVYQYAGMKDEALEQANILIQNESNFAALTDKAGSTAINNGNLKMYNDVIFALYSPKDQVDWDRLINHANDKVDDFNEERFLGLSSAMMTELYGSDLNTDWRALFQLEQRGAHYRSLKYYQQPESYQYGKVNNQLVPMIRMSEIYYIAAEAIYETDLSTALKYLKIVKKGRGLNVDLSGVTKGEFMNELVKDARREFIGEGQTLFMFKRLKRTIAGGNGDIIANEENLVLPLPDSESTIN